MSSSQYRNKNNYTQSKDKNSGRNDKYDKFNKYDDCRNRKYSRERG